MAGMSWSDLIERWLRAKNKPPRLRCVESFAKAMKEDEERDSRLRQRAGKTDTERAMCLRLADRLTLDPGIPRSLASKHYLRIVRASVAHELLALRADTHMHFVSIIPPNCMFRPDELPELNPRNLKRRLRRVLEQYGLGSNLDGWMFGYLEAEFNPETGLLQFHWHFLVASDHIEPFERLRRHPDYKGTRCAKDSPHGISKPIVVENISKKGKKTFLRIATYIMKTAPYARPRGYSANLGKKAVRFTGRLRRMPEPYFSQALLWLDKWRFQDMVMVANLRLAKTGLSLVRPVRRGIE